MFLASSPSALNTNTVETTLLTLPREIRDNVYQYLHRKLQVECVIDLDDTGFEPVPAKVQVTVEQAPIVSVLLVCTRLRDEYYQSVCLRHKYSAIFNVTPISMKIPDTFGLHAVRPRLWLQMKPFEHFTTKFAPLLRHLGKAIVLLDHCPDVLNELDYRYPRNSATISNFLLILNKSEGLNSAQIAIKRSFEHWSEDLVERFEAHCRQPQWVDQTLSRNFPPNGLPYPQGMKLVQECHGICVDSSGRSLKHAVTNNYLYSFARSPGDEEYWTSKGIFAFKLPRTYIPSIDFHFPRLSKEQKNAIRDRLGKMVLWREKRIDYSSNTVEKRTEL